MKPVFEYTKGMREKEMHYCPGCTHGIAHRLIMEVLEERGDLGNAIGVSPVGCSSVVSAVSVSLSLSNGDGRPGEFSLPHEKSDVTSDNMKMTDSTFMISRRISTSILSLLNTIIQYIRHYVNKRFHCPLDFVMNI